MNVCCQNPIHEKEDFGRTRTDISGGVRSIAAILRMAHLETTSPQFVSLITPQNLRAKGKLAWSVMERSACHGQALGGTALPKSGNRTQLSPLRNP